MMDGLELLTITLTITLAIKSDSRNIMRANHRTLRIATTAVVNSAADHYATTATTTTTTTTTLGPLCSGLTVVALLFIPGVRAEVVTDHFFHRLHQPSSPIPRSHFPLIPPLPPNLSSRCPPISGSVFLFSFYPPL